jgi:hypothetical protein
MPGWLSERSVPSDNEADALSADTSAQALQSESKMMPEETPRKAEAIARSTGSMSQHQRDELIAEVLGDVLVLSEKVNALSTQISAIAQTFTANDFVRWRNTLDLKMTELAEINLSQQAATRLQTFATTYLDHLSQETNKLVRLEVKRAVNDTMTFNKLFDKLNTDWLLRLTSIAAVVFASTLLANIVWSWFK